MSQFIERHNIAGQIAVFVIYFVAAFGSLYVYYTFKTSPALIWPPVGIALAAVIFGGYRMWLPILLAQHLSLIMMRPNVELTSLVIAISYSLQAVSALYLLRQFKFDPAIMNLRHTVALVGVAFLTTAIEPLILTAAQQYLGTLTLSPLESIARAWGGGIFSALVIVPFVTTWYAWSKSKDRTRNVETFERITAFALLCAVNYFLFWSPYPKYFGISVIFFLPAVLIWFALRFHPRWLTLALLITSVLGITGSIITHLSAVPLNEQLLSDEIYIGLIAAIFLVFTAVVEERRAAYRRLEAAYEAAAAADRAKNEFIAILAHELRNPLAPIVSSLELLKLQPQTSESNEIIQNAEQHTDMIKRLLDDLLDTARLAQKKFKLHKEIVDMRALVDQSVASVRDFAKSREHRIRITIEDDMKILADPVRVKQILINLMNNAAKYTQPGGTIDVLAERAGDEVRLRVTDTGIGIAPDVLSTLFEPFKQHDMHARVGTGLGLGLYLTRRIAEMHNGRVEATSAGTGLGSTFTVYLPLETGDAPLPEKHAVRTVPSTRVVIVDDNEAAANSLQKLLAHHKHEVAVAYSGKQALQTVTDFKPSIVFLDIGLPDMNGYDVARAIRASGWQGIIAALTGYGQDADRKLSEDAGIDHHLVKPVGVDDLIAVIPAV